MYTCEHGLLCLQTLLWRSPALHPVKTKPDQSAILLLMLGLRLNPSYLKLARKSLLLVPSAEGRGPEMLHAQLTMSLSPNSTKKHPPLSTVRSSCIWWALCFFPSLPCQGLARLLAWLEGVEKKKKRFQNPLARELQIYFRRAFFFSLKTKKPQGEIGNTGVKRVCFSFGQACLLSCPASVRTTALWGKRVAQTREEKCFSCKTAAKLRTLILALVT